MTLADGLEVHLVAAEPMVRQPVAIEFDDRGRLWVIQYLQYPNPAGLNRVKVDRFSRTAYDRTPEPPPRGPKGSDRVTILEDTDGDGRADRAHDFLSDLNLASGIAFGYGGVFILQAPYLLFYPDRDKDDRPDCDPEVLLSGFGMEDAHSVANSLTWGPDGWLYGLQGSTVTARVRGHEFQQGVWRYHPRNRRFELFCEGGGNMWGLDFDERGQLFASTNVGGSAMLHGVQGGYYWKSFGKHGPLHNPYTFGYFEHVPQHDFRGGHVTVGGLFYEADTWPAEWRGRYIAADLLGHAIHWHEVSALGSTFQARQKGDLLIANDTWFAPSDMTLGPDGAVYVADWHDKRTAHPDPDADWDRSNGRIVAITAKGAKPAISPDLASASTAELVALLRHPNTWYRRRARRMLAERRAEDATRTLIQTVIEKQGTEALEALWALQGSVWIDESLAPRLLAHRDASIRCWIVRLIGDQPPVSPALESMLVELAGREADVTVRAQLACTARRLSHPARLDLVKRLLLRDLDGEDRQIPLLLWWALEHHVMEALEETLTRFTVPEAWRSKLFRATIPARLVRRFAAEATPSGDHACLRLVVSAPDQEARRALWAELEVATRGRAAGSFSQELAQILVEHAEAHPQDQSLIRLAARVGNRAALEQVRRLATDQKATEADRRAMIELLGELKDREFLDRLIDIATHEPSSVIRLATLTTIGRFDESRVAQVLLATYLAQNEPWRSRARELLLSRASWAKAYLAAIDQGVLPASELTLDQLARYPALKAPDLAPLVRKHWGLTRGPTSEERLAEVRRLNNDLRAATGDAARGRLLFRDKCALCHRLNGQGEAIGPDLTFANRQDRDFLLTSLVDPAGVVRKEYQLYQLETRDGRILSGLIGEQTPATVTLRDTKGKRTQIERNEIADIKESEGSLMPESLYKEFRPEQLRDLFSFLQSERPEGRKEQP